MEPSQEWTQRVGSVDAFLINLTRLFKSQKLIRSWYNLRLILGRYKSNQFIDGTFFCGLAVRVPGSIPGAARFSEQ
jgi:hypothetical protein